MQITVARCAGFCFGVRRAVDMLESALAERGHACTLGPLIHNSQAVAEFASRGARQLEAAEEAPPGETVLIRAHGAAKADFEALEARGARVVDATCPCVKRVRELARESAARGRSVIAIGDGAHPEVRGVLSWAGDLGFAVASEAEADVLSPLESALVVAQTTLARASFEKILARIRLRVEKIEVVNTICDATTKRQAEAVRLAAESDVMVVVGGRQSANTRKLAELCAQKCARVHMIETAAELRASEFRPGDKVGITAGASTPGGTFKEVVARMNDIEKQEQVELQETQESPAESDFMADVEKTLVQIRPGQTVTGKVVQITEDEVCVNVGYKADGLVKKADLSSQDVKLGDEIEVEVVKVNDGEGNVLLSQRNIVNRKSWDAIVAACESGEFVTGTGKEAVKGGLIANVMGVRAFIPASQLSTRYVEKIEEFIGQDMQLKILEIDKAKKRVVASRKEVLKAEAEEKKKAIWDTLHEGEIVNGIVRRLTTFGAFVDIGGVDGLVHVTDLSWARVGHPSEIVSVNQEIPVKILKLDPERDRISLSYKQTQPKPWDVAGDKYAPGSIVSGKVVRIVPYGAFVELEPGLDGMVHISQCALRRIDKVEDAVKVGDVIRVKVLSVDTEAKRISLSIREVLEDEAFEGVEEAGGDSFQIAGEETNEQA